MTERKNIIKNLFQKAVNFTNNTQSRIDAVNRINIADTTRSIDDNIYYDLQNRKNYIQSTNDIISVALRTINNKFNSFDIKTYIKKNDEKIYQDTSLSELFKRPNSITQRTMVDFNNALVRSFYIDGEIYIQYDKLYNTLSILDQQDVSIIKKNSYLLRGFDKMPTEIQLNITIIDNNMIKTNSYHNYIYDFARNYYTCKEQENLILLRINDNRYSDTRYQQTSVMTTVSKLIAIYENYLNSMYSYGSNATNGKIITVLTDAIGGEEKMRKLRELFNNHFRGVDKHGSIGFLPIQKGANEKPDISVLDISTTPKDMLFTEIIPNLRNYICQAFGIPEQLLDSSNAHFDSRDSADITFSEDIYNTLNNIYKNIEYFYNTVLQNKNDKYIYVEIDKMSCLSLYKKELMKFKEMKEYLSINEARAFFNKEPKEGQVYDSILRNAMSMPLESQDNQYIEEENRTIDKDKIDNNIDNKSIFSNRRELEDALIEMLDNVND